MRDHTDWVQKVFDRAASKYGEPGYDHFTHFGQRLVEQSDVRQGSKILDVATGKGAVLFPLIHAMGPHGKAYGIDISENMILECRKKLKDIHRSQVILQKMDAQNLHYPANYFDDVFCGFALFFFSSLSTALSEFKRVLKPNGRLAVSVWGKKAEIYTWMKQKTREFGAEKNLMATLLNDHEILLQAIKEAKFGNIRLSTESYTFWYPSAEAWWESLWTHGTRSSLEQLPPDNLALLKEMAIRKIRLLQCDKGIPEEFQVHYAYATRD